MPLEASIIDNLRSSLTDEKSKIESDLNKIASKKPHEAGYETKFNEIGTGEDENASEVEEYTDNLALENTLEKQLKDINDALIKIESGKYGLCEKCGKEIDLERLKAYPSAKNCIDCQ